MGPSARRIAILAALASGLLGVACSDGGDTGSTGSSAGTSGSSGTTGGSGAGTTGGSGTTGGDTFTSWASPSFFKLYCVSCHSAGKEGDPAGSNLDWTSYPDVQMNANDIRCGVATAQDPSWNCRSDITAMQFPIGGGPKPSTTDRIRLVSWIDAGVPE